MTATTGTTSLPKLYELIDLTKLPDKYLRPLQLCGLCENPLHQKKDGSLHCVPCKTSFSAESVPSAIESGLIKAPRGRVSDGAPHLHLTNIGEDCKIDASYLRYILSGERRPSLAAMQRLCKVLRLDMNKASQCFTGSTRKPPKKKAKQVTK